jgi:hypothetical protein
MVSKVGALGILVLVLASGCDDKPTQDNAAKATLEENIELGGTARASVRRELGGNVLAFEDFQAELALHKNGLVRALVYDTEGKRLTPAERAKMNVVLSAEGGVKPALDLAYDAKLGCLRGQADVHGGLGLGPIVVKLDVDGKTFTGNLSEYVLLPAPRFGGSVLATGGYSVELVAKPELVSAFVFDAAGNALAKGDLDLKLRVAGAASDLQLAWDAESESYRAALDGKLDVASLPLRLTLTAAGKVNIGAAMSLKMIAEASASAHVEAVPVAQANVNVDVAAPAVGVGLAANANSKLKAAADLKAKALAEAKAAADLKAKAAADAKLKATAAVKPPAVRATATKSASAKAGTSGVKANANASFGFGSK